MKTKRSEGPTARIVQMARSRPGGVIRWHEARDVYLEASATARSDEKQAASRARRGFRLTSSSGGRHFHLTLNQLLERNFFKVDGTRGYWVLKSTVFNDFYTEDKQELAQFRANFGLDDNGMSISHPRYTIGAMQAGVDC